MGVINGTEANGYLNPNRVVYNPDDEHKLFPKDYCVIYRIGGTENFQWRRSAGMSKLDAIQYKNDVIKQGYHALIEKHELSLSIGLPDTY